MAKPTQQDAILYCENCGISFLWSVEEQGLPPTAPSPGPAPEHRASDTPPTKPIHCPGCRALLPKAGRERGVVKWYNRRKRFGFIVRRDQPDLFVHGSQLDGTGHLAPDDLVEFGITETDKGLAAAGVRRVEPDADSTP